MDVAEMMEQSEQRETALAEEKLKAKMRRQIRIFNKEKYAYTRRTRYEASKQRRALSVLETERDVEVDNYIATQSEAVEKKYQREEAVVRDLVKTTDKVIDLLNKEKKNIHKLENNIYRLGEAKWRHKRQATELDIQNNFFRIPDNLKMERRIEWASGRYHLQLHRNKSLEDKIDSAVYTRQKYMKEEARLLSELDGLNKYLTSIMSTTAEIYEQRDRAEGTKLKVREHLAKVKDEYERELLTITLSINDDIKMENFMRTKHKDITQYLQQKRDREYSDAMEMINKKDVFTDAFDTIRLACGKDDINNIIMDFIDAEENNFGIFLSIGDILDENEKMRDKIRDLRAENVHMEERDIGNFKATDLDIREIQGRIDSYRMKCEACQKRLQEDTKLLDEFTQHIETILGVIQLDKATLSDYVGKDGRIKDTNLLGVMTAIEKEVATQMKDYYMVELSTRAVARSKVEMTPDDKMLTRIPSFRIAPHLPPKITPSNLLREKDEIEDVKSGVIMGHDDVRDIIIKSMIEKSTVASKAKGQGPRKKVLSIQPASSTDTKEEKETPNQKPPSETKEEEK